MKNENNLSNPLFITAMLLSFVGIAIAGYLTYHHYSIFQTGITETSFCNFGGAFNCDSVLLSKYSMFYNIPTAGFALLFYIYCLGSLIVAFLNSDKSKSILLPSFILSIISLAASLFLAYVSSVILESYCIYCVSMYVINLGLFVILLKSQLPLSEISNACTNVNWIKHLIAGVIIFGLGSGGLYLKQQSIVKEIKIPPIDKIIEAHLKQKPVEMNTQNRPYWGNPNAKVVIAEFSDFQCPFCKRAALNLKPALAEFKKHIKLVFMHFPLDYACNSDIKRPMHPVACKAAYASYCANQQGKFWEYHDLVFENQKHLNENSFEEIAKMLKLNMEAFNQCSQDSATKQAIQQDLQEGQKIGLQGTPSVFINGRPIQLWPYRDVLKAIVKSELEKIN